MPDIHAVKVIENGQEVVYDIADNVARNGHFIGDVYANANNDFSGGDKLPDETRVNELIASAIGGITGFSIIIVNSLPQVGDSNTIYFVLTKQGNAGDIYDEYMYINSTWEQIGTTQVDLSSKADKADTVLDTTLSRGRKANTTVGAGSIAFGNDVQASGLLSQAYGIGSKALGAQSHAEGNGSMAVGDDAHAEGYSKAIGNYSHSEGYNTTAGGIYAHAEGFSTVASVPGAHAEGNTTTASGENAHAEGYNTTAYGKYSHAEGDITKANGEGSHAEGYNATASGTHSHAEGWGTTASGMRSHAEGDRTTASGPVSHAEGYYTTASDDYAHAEGDHTTASNNAAHAEGQRTVASGYASHAEGVGDSNSGTRTISGVTYNVGASGTGSHAEGSNTIAYGNASHAEGAEAYAIGDTSHAEGNLTIASGNQSHVEGVRATASGDASHAEGGGTTASGYYSHAEGSSTTASAMNSHAEGGGTTASGSQAHAEGAGTQATGLNSHAEGGGAIASGGQSHAEGAGTKAVGENSHAEGANTVANGQHSHVGGINNVPDNYDDWSEWAANTEYGVGDKVKRTTIENGNTVVKGYVCKTANNDLSFDHNKWLFRSSMMNYAVIIGNGDGTNGVVSLSNAYALDWDGNEYLAGNVYVNCGTNSKGGTKLPDETRVNELIASAIGGISSLNIVIVQALPQVGSSDTIYFVLKSGSQNDIYDEYMYINNSWELLGTKEIDISSKADKADTVLDTTLSRGRTLNSVAGTGSFAFGNNVTASGDYSHAEGGSTSASGYYSHAEGNVTTADGYYTHAEGSMTTASGMAAHAEGDHTIANGNNAHAEGSSTTANGENSHASGAYNVPDSYDAWPEWVSGTQYEVGDKVKRTRVVGGKTIINGYICTTANSDYVFDSSKWLDRSGRMNHVVIVGNGAYNANSNAYALEWDGTGRFAGDVYVGCNPDSTGGTRLLTESDVPAVATIPETQAIIDEYDSEEEDEGMIVETEYYEVDSTDKGYRTIMDADDIGAAYKTGKSIIFHFPTAEDPFTPNQTLPQSYGQLVYYSDANEYYTAHQFTLAPNSSSTGNEADVRLLIGGNAANVREDGKLYFQFYLD